METIILLFIMASFILSFKRTAYGCCCLLVSRILIPEFVRMSALNISLNSTVIGIVMLFCIRDILLGYYNGKLLLSNKYVKALLLFSLYWFISLPFADSVKTVYQQSQLLQFFITDIIPTICFIIGIKTLKDLKLALITLFVCSAISCLWGLASLAIGSNIYVNYLSILYDNIRFDGIEELDDTRGFAATSGTFAHANGWGYFLPIAFVLAVYIYNLRQNKLILLVSVMLTIGVFICGKRSALVAYFMFGVAYFFFSKGSNKKRIIGYAVLSFVVVIIAVNVIPQLYKMKGFIESSIFFWDDTLRDKNSIGGSSWNMRVDQVTYCFVEVADNLLFGHGFGWTRYYLVFVRPFHPILFGFENLVSDAVCNGGVFGLIAWIYIFVQSYKYSICGSKTQKHILFCKLFTIVQATIAMATGLSYFIFYGVFIVMLNKFTHLKYNENINSNRLL